ncbi:MAG TPA: DUF4388 domain-containing protein, partial [Ktedonobacteraceae bacterium]|nr:DUF4388 domain-containing protein [Ktedonobacteraceae bacterium]
ALEGGVVSYLIKPVDMHVLKEELRRLLQQTGFSASLDSFDLLDLIQIISMSHKTIALIVNTGLEEQGTLRFRNGELVWAEYGILRGEEAFFALAAHKNGTVIHQPWNEQITSNVMQPLSRLIFQALQYRAKYAAAQQLSGEQAAVKPNLTRQDAIDDSPFLVLAEASGTVDPATPITPLFLPEIEQAPQPSVPVSPRPAASEEREWWQQSSQHRSIHKPRSVRPAADGSTTAPLSNSNGHQGSNNVRPAHISSSPVRRPPVRERTDLPSWLLEQPTQFDLPAMRLKPSAATGQVPATSVQKQSQPSPAEWQPPPPGQITGSQPIPKAVTGFPVARQSIHNAGNQAASPEWQPPEDGNVNKLQTSEPLKSLVRQTDDLRANAVYQQPARVAVQEALAPNGAPAVDEAAANGVVGVSPSWGGSGTGSGPLRVAKRNYPALVAALQTLGYTVPGFIASAVVGLDGQPIAQVAVDELDISLLCGYFSTVMQGALLSLNQGRWGNFEQTVITSATHHILLRIVGGEKEAFQVLITSHEMNPVESLSIMANVESAIASALR